MCSMKSNLIIPEIRSVLPLSILQIMLLSVSSFNPAFADGKNDVIQSFIEGQRYLQKITMNLQQDRVFNIQDYTN